MKRHIRIGASTCVDMIDAFRDRIQQLQTNSGYIGNSTYINSAYDNFTDLNIDDEYIDTLMSEVADETTMLEINPGICTWDITDTTIVFIITGFNGDSIDEYTCPIADLTGDINTDLNYILDSITM